MAGRVLTVPAGHCGKYPATSIKGLFGSGQWGLGGSSLLGQAASPLLRPQACGRSYFAGASGAVSQSPSRLATSGNSRRLSHFFPRVLPAVSSACPCSQVCIAELRIYICIFFVLFCF